MKKRMPIFASGFLAAILAGSLVLTAFAASGQVSFEGVNVALMGKQVIGVDEMVLTSGGQEVPGSIIYTDSAGGGTVYLPMRKISELLDASIDFDAVSCTVYIGGVPTSGGGISVTSPDGSVTNVPPESGTATIPHFIYNETDMGPFTKAASERSPAAGMTNHIISEARYQSKYDFDQTYRCIPSNGKYVSVTVTNNHTESSEALIVNLFHDKAVGPKACIPAVHVDSGETVTITFEINDNATDLNCNLGLNVTFGTAMPYSMDTTVSVVQYN